MTVFVSAGERTRASLSVLWNEGEQRRDAQNKLLFLQTVNTLCIWASAVFASLVYVTSQKTGCISVFVCNFSAHEEKVEAALFFD